MNRYIIFFILITSPLLSFSQKLEPFQVKGKFGYKDPLTNNVLISPQFDYASPFFYGRAQVVQNQLYGCINPLGNLVVPYKKYDFISSFVENRAMVKSQEMFGFIDTSGNEIIPCKYERAITFQKGLASVRLYNKWGFIDKYNNTIIPIRYDKVEQFHESRAAVNIGGKGKLNQFSGGLWGFVDLLGKEIIPLVYDSVEDFRNGKARVKQNKMWNWIDLEGRKIDTTNYGNNEGAGNYKKVRDINIYYEIYGQGQPLLFIHPNGGSISSFSHQIPYFSKKYMVIIADSRAHGKTVDYGDSLSYEMMADDFYVFLDSLHIKSCFVVGWSDGGISGLLLSIRHPEKVEKLSVTGANLWPDTSAVDAFTYNLVRNKIEGLKDSALNNAKFEKRRKLLHLLAYEPHITIDQLKTIHCPTLVIGGDHDIILPRHTMLIAQSIPKSYLWIVPNSGHAVPIGFRDQFNIFVDRFLANPYWEIKDGGRNY